MRRWICLVAGLTTLVGGGLLGCGEDDGEIVRPSVSVRNRQCIGDDTCVDAQSYFFEFRSSRTGDYAVTLHDSEGRTWAKHETGTVVGKDLEDVNVPVDDVPDGGTIRITVVTDQGGTGSASCPAGTEFVTGSCD